MSDFYLLLPFWSHALQISNGETGCNISCGEQWPPFTILENVMRWTLLFPWENSERALWFYSFKISCTVFILQAAGRHLLKSLAIPQQIYQYALALKYFYISGPLWGLSFTQYRQKILTLTLNLTVVCLWTDRRNKSKVQETQNIIKKIWSAASGGSFSWQLEETRNTSIKCLYFTQKQEIHCKEPSSTHNHTSVTHGGPG